MAISSKNVCFYFVSGQTVDPHEIGIVSSRAPDEYKAFMVAYFKTPNHARSRRPRAARKKKQDRYYDVAGYNPYSMFSNTEFFIF